MKECNRDDEKYADIRRLDLSGKGSQKAMGMGRESYEERDSSNREEA